MRDQDLEVSMRTNITPKRYEPTNQEEERRVKKKKRKMRERDEGYG